MKFISLFTGIAGLDLGLEQAGMACVAQVERDPACQRLLARHYPTVRRFSDVTTLDPGALPAADLLCGGDPCPIRSRARSNGASVHPDLSGYFLALVGRLRPRWVLRENVPAPDDVCFDASLGYLGYGTAIIRLDAAAATGQSRQRDFIVGRYQTSRDGVRECFHDCTDGAGAYTTRLGTEQVIPALTTKRTRYDSRDCYVYEGGRLRILDGDERTRFAGFPAGWTDGFSEATRARMTGNSAVPAVARFLGEAIMAYEKRLLLES